MNQFQIQSSSYQQQSKQSLEKFYPSSPLEKHTHAAINICEFRKLKLKQQKQNDSTINSLNGNKVIETRHISESKSVSDKIIEFVSCKLRVLNQLAALNNPNDLLIVSNSSEFQHKVLNSKKVVEQLDKAAKVFLQTGYQQKKQVSINQIHKFLEKFSKIEDKLNFIHSESSHTGIQSPRLRIKNIKQQLSTNHVSRVNSNNVTKRSRNQYKANAISSWNQYEVGSQQEQCQYSNNQSTFHKEGQEILQLKQNQGFIKKIENQERINQNTFQNEEQIILSESKETLEQYYYHFILSLAATKSHYKQFLNELLEEIQFDQHDSQVQRKVIQKKMRTDTDYSLNMLSTILKSKIDRQERNDSKLTTGILAKNKLFLQLCRQFLDINVQQLSKSIRNFQSKYNSVRQILLKVQKINSFQDQAQTHIAYKLTDTLTKYLPSEQMPLNQFTFSPRSINKMNFNIDRHGKMLENKHFVSSALNILKKNILKITFNRIRYCQRYEFDAVLRISDVITNSILIQDNLNEGFVGIQQYVEQLEYQQDFEANIFEIMLKNNLKKAFKAWKSIRSTKLKVLKQLLRKKTIKAQKQKLFIFSQWRVNVSRRILGQKMMAHSKSCSSIINKFSNTYSLNKRADKNPTNQFNAEQAKQLTSRKSSASKIKNKYSKSSNNLKASFAIQNYSRTRKGLNYDIKESIKSKPNLKLLNYQYKQKIQDRLIDKDTMIVMTGQNKMQLKRYSKLPISQSMITKQNRLKEMKNRAILRKH